MVTVMDSKEHRDWLLDVMQRHGLNEKQWADKAGLSTPNILYNYLSGRSKSISEDSRIKLGEVVGLSADEMRMGAQNPHEKSLNKSNLIQRNEAHTASIAKRKVPVYGPASAGEAGRILITDEFIVEWDDMPDELETVKDGFKMIVAGSSMEPRYYDGEKVSVHPYRKPSVGQDCVIVDEDGNALVKRYMGETETDWKLSQYNPAKNFTIKRSKVRNLYSILGRS